MKWALVTLVTGYVAVWLVDQIGQYILPIGVGMLLLFLFSLTRDRIEGLQNLEDKAKVALIIVLSTGGLVLVLRWIIQSRVIDIWLYPPIFAGLVLVRGILRWLINLNLQEPQSFGIQSETDRGEIVRSKAEKRVADWLYAHGIEYEYERKIDLPGDDVILSDFYLMTEDIFIEYWGLGGSDNEVGERYRARKYEKIDLYEKYNYKLISLYPHHLYELDSYLPQEIERLNGETDGFWSWFFSLFRRTRDENRRQSSITNASEKIFCTNCGNEATQVGEYCVKCGNQIMELETSQRN